jgi:4-alpha-glucanotransferase
MNRPGTAEGNWRWRSTEGMLSPTAFEALRELTEASARSAAVEKTGIPASTVVAS